MHFNFLKKPEYLSKDDNELLLRQGIQFHWKNDNYKSFDEFLKTLSSRKRKVIIKERTCIKKNNLTTLQSIKTEVGLRIDYIEQKINQYQRDIKIGKYVIKNWTNIDFDSITSKTKNDRSIVLTLKAYRAINLPVSIYNSLNSDGSIAKLDQDSIKVILNNLYEVFPAHIIDGVENERVLYHSFNEFIINNYPRIVEDGIGELEKNDYKKFFNDDIVLGYVLEKTHLRKFILRLITNYHNRLINLEGML